MDAEIRGANGSLIIFKGMQTYNAETIKSLEGYDIAFVEEGQIMPSFSGWVLLPLVTFPYAFYATKMVFTRDTYKELLPTKRHLARLLLAFSFLFAIGLAGL